MSWATMDFAILACKGCKRRWIKDGKTCHSECEDYIREKEEYKAKKEWLKKMNETSCKSHDFN